MKLNTSPRNGRHVEVDARQFVLIVTGANGAALSSRIVMGAKQTAAHYVVALNIHLVPTRHSRAEHGLFGAGYRPAVAAVAPTTDCRLFTPK